jgi:hypothetical protein
MNWIESIKNNFFLFLSKFILFYLKKNSKIILFQDKLGRMYPSRGLEPGLKSMMNSDAEKGYGIAGYIGMFI